MQINTAGDSTMPPRILLIDDRILCKDLMGVLKAKGYLPFVIHRPEEAIQRCQETFFPIVLIDNALPGVSGVDVLKHIKEKSPDTEVIMVTGLSKLETTAGALNAGAFAYMQKPLDLEHLLFIISKALEQQELRTENRKLVGGLVKYVKQLEETTKQETLARQQAEALQRVTQACCSALELKEVLEIAVRQMTEVLGADRCSIFLPDAALEVIADVVNHGLPDPLKWVLYSTLKGKRISDFSIGPVLLEATEPIVIEEAAHSDLLPRALVESLGMRSLLLVPARLRDKYLAVVSLGYVAHQHTFTSKEIDLAKSIVNQVAVAIENAQLFEEKVKQGKFLIARDRILEAITGDIDITRVFKTFAEEVKLITNSQRVSILLVDEAERLSFFAVDTLAEPPKLPVGFTVAKEESAIGALIDSKRPLIVPDLRSQPDSKHGRLLLQEGIRSLLALPIVSKERLIGVVKLGSTQINAFSQTDIEILEPLMRQLAIAMEKSKLYNSLNEKIRELATLNVLASVINQSLDIDAMLTNVVNKILELLDVDACGIHLLDEASDTFIFKAYKGFPEEFASEVRVLQKSTRLTGLVSQSGTPFVIKKLAEHPMYEGIHATYELNTFVCVPLSSKDKMIGAIILATIRRECDFSDSELLVLSAIGNQLGITIENVWLLEQILRANADAERARALEEKNKELESFAYVVSHDLKAPLISLQGYASTLLEEYEDKLDERGRYCLERLQRNAERMEVLINGLLELSHIDRGMKTHDVDVSEIIEEVLEEFQEPIEKGRIEVAISNGMPKVRCDPVRLRQVYSNLIGNAIKFMGPNPNPMIEIGARNDDVSTEFFVRDNGIGIDPAYHRKIFNLFERLREIDAEGTGIGLAIVKKIIEAHNGTIRVQSQRGEGSTFYFTLPRTEKARSAAKGGGNDTVTAVNNRG